MFRAIKHSKNFKKTRIATLRIQKIYKISVLVKEFKKVLLAKIRRERM